MTTTFDLATIPDSALARGATALLGSVAEPWLVEHSLRTYRFGTAVLGTIGLVPDLELLYVASMLHDVAMGTVLDDAVTPFHLRGAAVAGSVVLTHGRSDAEATLIYDAIALHLDLATAEDPRPEVAGVHLGAVLDVVGLRVDDLPPEVIEAVVAAHPRLDFKANLLHVMADEVTRKPYGAAAVLARDFGFADLIAAAPFDE